MKSLITALFFLSCLTTFNKVQAQDVSMKVVFISYSNVDPDGVGPATGSAVFEFQLASSAGTIMGDALALLALFQSSKLMATPTNTVVPVGPLAAASGWTQNGDNRTGNDVAPAKIVGGHSFDKRMVIAFAQGSATPNLPITTTFTGIARVTYWTLGNTNPQGGVITVEPGADVPQNSLSSDGGATEYPYLTPFSNVPLSLGSPLPVVFSSFDVDCTEKGAAITWTTASETNTAHFEVEKNTSGIWATIATIAAAGNSGSLRKYQVMDLEAGTAQYRIKQVDLDGKFVYTQVRNKFCTGRNLHVFIYPVPARNILHLAIKSSGPINTQLEIYDMRGRLVQSQSATLNRGANNITINVAGLAGGQYILRSSNGALTINKKFTIAR